MSLREARGDCGTTYKTDDARRHRAARWGASTVTAAKQFSSRSPFLKGHGAFAVVGGARAGLGSAQGAAAPAAAGHAFIFRDSFEESALGATSVERRKVLLAHKIKPGQTIQLKAREATATMRDDGDPQLQAESLITAETSPSQGSQVWSRRHAALVFRARPSGGVCGAARGR